MYDCEVVIRRAQLRLRKIRCSARLDQHTGKIELFTEVS
jgi:hypothetical protein